MDRSLGKHEKCYFGDTFCFMSNLSKKVWDGKNSKGMKHLACYREQLHFQEMLSDLFKVYLKTRAGTDQFLHICVMTSRRNIYIRTIPVVF